MAPSWPWRLVRWWISRAHYQGLRRLLGVRATGSSARGYLAVSVQDLMAADNHRRRDHPGRRGTQVDGGRVDDHRHPTHREGRGARRADGVPVGPTRRTARSWGAIRDRLQRGPRPLAALSPETSLIRALHTHALCLHMQRASDRRRRSIRRHEPAAHRPTLPARTLHRHAYADLSRPREKHPRNSAWPQGVSATAPD